jgi:predicted enzyme related to lactoylglutathione lyase
MPPGSLRGLVIDCEHLEAEHRLLTEPGVRCLGPPASQPGGTFATLLDPDGNHLSLRQTGSAPNV